MLSARSIKLQALSSPFGLQPKGLAFALSPNFLGDGQSCKVLDYGSRTGDFLIHLSSLYPSNSCVGVDLSVADVDAANLSAADLNNVCFQSIEKGLPLPFGDSTFKAIYIIGVLEHIADKPWVLSELRRIISHDGFLFIGVPGLHLFSFLDMGNFKFRFPWIHKAFISLRYGDEYYKEKYSQNPSGLFGDVEIEAGWHYHFSVDELTSLLVDAGFDPQFCTGIGFFQRIIINIMYFIPLLKKPLSALLNLDSMYFSSTELFFVCADA